MSRLLLAKRRDQRAVSTVTANLLMVVMTIGMAGSFFVMTTSLISPYTPPSTTRIALQSAGTYHSEAPGYCCLNDSFVQVIKATGTLLYWTPPVHFVITSFAGDVLVQGDLEPAPASDFYLGVYHAGPGFASIPVVGYIDVDPLGVVSEADTVQIYGMSEEYHGATLQLSTATLVLAVVTID